ncbi:MAG: alkaline phosphatase family protein, partial [Acidobacteriota bacterium]
MKNSVILLEFNELCPTLMTEFIAGGHLPNFSRLYDEAFVYVSDAEAKAPALEPWIQWITVHTGLTHEQHGVYDLGDGHKVRAPRVWDLLKRAGKTSWICGSMNTDFEKPFEALFLPDPWSAGVRPFPEKEFAPYYDFVSRNVQEYTRDRVPLSHADYLAFLRFMVAHGLSLSTATETAAQLMRERTNRQTRWQRATILDRLQWDVFTWYQKRYNPDFSTFFLNSTAHFQHMYWRNMQPDLFQVKPTAEEQAEHEDSILTGYQNMDEIVGKCLKSFGDRSTIILASAL